MTTFYVAPMPRPPVFASSPKPTFPERVPIEEVAAALGVEVEVAAGVRVASLGSVLQLVNPTRPQNADGSTTVLIDVDKVWRLAIASAASCRPGSRAREVRKVDAASELERAMYMLDAWESETLVASRLERVNHPVAAQAAALLRQGQRSRRWTAGVLVQATAGTLQVPETEEELRT